MKLKDYLTSDIKANELLEKTNELIDNLAKELSGFYSTLFIVNKYTPVIEDLKNAYNTSFNQKCYITSFDSNTLYSFINRNSKYKLHYTDASYENAVKAEITLLLAKYKYLHECQIKLAFMMTLKENFIYYTKSGYDESWMLEFNINIIKNIYNDVMNTELKDFPILKENTKLQDTVRNNAKRPAEKVVYVPTKPTKVSHLTDLFEDGMTQVEKTKAVSEYWGCSEKTATRYMKKFGLWNRVKKTSDTDYKALYENALKEIEGLKMQIENMKRGKETFDSHNINNLMLAPTVMIGKINLNKD